MIVCSHVLPGSFFFHRIASLCTDIGLGFVACIFALPARQTMARQEVIFFRGLVHWNNLSNEAKSESKCIPYHRLIKGREDERLNYHPT